MPNQYLVLHLLVRTFYLFMHLLHGKRKGEAVDGHIISHSVQLIYQRHRSVVSTDTVYVPFIKFWNFDTIQANGHTGRREFSIFNLKGEKFF